MHRGLLVIAFLFLNMLLTAQKTATVHYIDSLPAVDGVIEERWEKYMTTERFTQLEPDKGAPSADTTGMIILQNEEKIYFGFKCYQSVPVTAKITTRDRLGKEDDGILVTLGTFFDHRSSYGFLVYPLGTQIDLMAAEDGKTTDVNLDVVWDAAAQIYDWGYIIEMAIPYRSLQYDKKGTSWDFNVGRVIRERSEISYWSGEIATDFRISQGGILAPVIVPRPKSKFALYPYARGSYEKGSETDANGRFMGDVGGDIQWQPTPGITVNGTVNPDFATIEADAEQVNLTRYELSYPEKRLFFLEGNEMFSTRIRTFYSRRIGDILYGAKVKGKAGKYAFNGLHTYALENPDSDEPQAFYTAATVRRDFLKASTIGLIITDKSWKGGYARSASLDYTLNLKNDWKLTGQGVISAPGNVASHSAFFVRFAREDINYHYHIRYSNIGKDFMDNVNQTGFIVDDDRHELDGDYSNRWWFRSNVVKYFNVLAANNIFWSHSGTLRSWYLTYLANVYFQNRFNLELSYNNEFKLFDKKYYNHKYGVQIGYNTDEWSNASLDFTWGRNFDRDFWLLTGTTRFKITEKFAVNYTADLLHFSPDTSNSSAFINRLTLTYNFTRDLWVKVFFQNNSSFNRIYYYGLAGWRFKPPFGALYLIVNHDEFDILMENSYNHQTVVYLKFTYPILF